MTVEAEQTRDVHPMSVQCCANVADGGPALYRHWVNVSRWLGWYRRANENANSINR